MQDPYPQVKAYIKDSIWIAPFDTISSHPNFSKLLIGGNTLRHLGIMSKIWLDDYEVNGATQSIIVMDVESGWWRTDLVAFAQYLVDLDLITFNKDLDFTKYNPDQNKDYRGKLLIRPGQRPYDIVSDVVLDEKSDPFRNVGWKDTYGV